VRYDSNPVRLEHLVEAWENYFRSGYKNIWPAADIIYARKAKEWAGEEEVRFFAPVDCPNVPFKEQAINGIIFGAKTSGCLVQMVRRALFSWRVKPRLFKVSIEKSTQRLWIEKYGNLSPHT
jgi:hypothetical protein